LRLFSANFYEANDCLLIPTVNQISISAMLVPRYFGGFRLIGMLRKTQLEVEL